MDTIVLKFGGSSLANNEKLNMVSEKIIDLKNKKHNIVAVVSAQGKTTDRILKEAYELDANICDRELDMLLSVGEQISAAKLAVVLNKKGYKAVSLTGWQSGIYTDTTNTNAQIQHIDVERIQQELDNNNIVVITGFQGINKKIDITTLGRGGSDTSAVALSAALNAKNCYIFSDVDGVYTLDPNKYDSAIKLSAVSYNEMKEISNEGAKVLHNRCVEIAEKFKIPIITKSTFNNKPGTVISDIIEENTIKSILKKDISRISLVGNGIFRDTDKIKILLDIIEKEKLELLELNIFESKIIITFKNIIDDKIIETLHKIFI